MIYAFVKSKNHSFNYLLIVEHFGDSILPYITDYEEILAKSEQTILPTTLKSKVKYVNVRLDANTRCQKRQCIFPNSTIDVLKREIR